jgi:hypothetical protein
MQSSNVIQYFNSSNVTTTSRFFFRSDSSKTLQTIRESSLVLRDHQLWQGLLQQLKMCATNTA